MRSEASLRVSASLEGKFGEKSRRWKGEDASYTAKHMWIHKHYGKASKCSFNPNHKAKRYEWANISGEYKRDVGDFMQLCPSCHRKFDRKPHCINGHLFTDDNTYIDPRGYRGCRTCRRNQKEAFKRRGKRAIN